MKKIYKYELGLMDVQKVEVPKGATFISSINQNDSIVAYAIVDPAEKEMIKKEFLIFGTGHDFGTWAVEEKFKFLGSVAIVGGMYVWHIFVEK